MIGRRAMNRPPPVARRSKPGRGPAGFTLFELILAIALSATLLGLIGTAINLYLRQVEGSRTDVEQAQLARSILAMIADDIRATTIYQTQDTSSVEALAASAAEFDVDDIDSEDTSAGMGSSLGGGAGQDSDSEQDNSPSEQTSSTNEQVQFSSALEPGLNGLLSELILDVARLPRLDELFPPAAEQAATTPTANLNTPRPSDVKSVRYFVRPGQRLSASDAATTSLDQAAQMQWGGLVRQTLDRAMRDMAEQSGNAALLETGQELIAPEVVHLEFRYFDGTSAWQQWEMQQMQTLPLAVEVRIWLATDDAEPGQHSPASSSAPPASVLSGSQMYSETVALPLFATSSGASSRSSASGGGSAGQGGAPGGSL